MDQVPQKIELVFYKSKMGNEPVRDWLLGAPDEHRRLIGVGSGPGAEVAPLRVSVKRPSGEVALDASAQGGVKDTGAMAGLPPGATRPYGFAATPGKVYSQVAVGDEVAGALTVSVDGQAQQVSLPTTKVTTVRIP